MTRRLEEMSKEELIAALRRTQPASHDGEATPPQPGPIASVAALDPQSRTRYADLYELAPVAYLTLDRHARILECNLEAASLFGRPRSELVGAALPSVVTIEERVALEQHLERCFTAGTRSTGELTFSTWSGRVSVEMVSVPVFGGSGDVSCCNTAMTDITAIRLSEERLRVLSATGEALVSSLDYSTTLTVITRIIVPLLGDIVFFDIVEEDGKIARYAPQPSRAILGATDTPQAIVLDSGQPMLMPTCSRETMQRAVWGGQDDTPPPQAGSLLLVPLQARDRNLGVMTCVISGGRRHHTAGDLRLGQQIAARAAMAVDNARLYLAARRAIRAREDVAAIVSHDLRNPLMGIRLHCEHLRETPELRVSPGMRHIEAIERGVKSMERLIRDLLDMSRIEAGQLVIYRGDHELGSLVSEAVNAARPLAERKGIALAVALPAPADGVFCDRERILQVLSNVIGNAIKFTPTDGTIEVEVLTDGAETTFVVRDSGAGIPADHLPHLFERYWRANRTDNKGVGLGLYIAKAIIGAHGGEIVVESDVGVGTIVRFNIPHRQAAVPTSDGRAPLADRGRSEPS